MLVQRFSQDNGPVKLFVESVKRQFQFFTSDSTMYIEFNLCGGDKLLCHLYNNKGNGYKELSSLYLTAIVNFPYICFL